MTSHSREIGCCLRKFSAGFADIIRHAFQTESSDPSGGDEDRNLKQWQTFNVATEEISTIHNKLSDHCNDSVKILQIKSKAPVKEMQLSDADKDQSLLPTSESSNNQSHPTEVSKENVQNRNEKVLDWPTSQETRLSSTENNDENPTVCGDSADKFQITTSADYTHSACDTVEQECENTAATAYASDPPKQGKPIDLNGNSCEESQILRYVLSIAQFCCHGNLLG